MLGTREQPLIVLSHFAALSLTLKRCKLLVYESERETISAVTDLPNLKLLYVRLNKVTLKQLS